MTSTKPRLTAVERARRKEIRELIRKAREVAVHLRSVNLYMDYARLLDDLAGVAEKYLKGLKHG